MPPPLTTTSSTIQPPNHNAPFDCATITPLLPNNDIPSVLISFNPPIYNIKNRVSTYRSHVKHHVYNPEKHRSYKELRRVFTCEFELAAWDVVRQYGEGENVVKVGVKLRCESVEGGKGGERLIGG